MERAAAEFAGQAAQGQAVFYVLLDVAADGADQRGLGISVYGFGTAAKAGAVSGLLGFAGAVEKADVFAARALRWARRTTENSGARDGEDEGAVQGGVAVSDGLPAAGVDWIRLHDCCLGKYRIGCHADNIRQAGSVGYPNVAVKVIYLQNAGLFSSPRLKALHFCAICGMPEGMP